MRRECFWGCAPTCSLELGLIKRTEEEEEEEEAKGWAMIKPQRPQQPCSPVFERCGVITSPVLLRLETISIKADMTY